MKGTITCTKLNNKANNIIINIDVIIAACKGEESLQIEITRDFKNLMKIIF